MELSPQYRTKTKQPPKDRKALKEEKRRKDLEMKRKIEAFRNELK